jgi:hypothetical protein
MKHLTTRAVLFVSSFVLSFKAAPPATTVTTNEFIPFSQATFVPCANGGAGEIVLVSGTLHVLSHTTINGNNASLKTHFQPQGARGIGQVTGDEYNAVGVTQEHDKIPLSGSAGEFTFINNFRLIGPGPNNNLMVHQTIHMTVNANGTVTSQVDNSTTDCQ